MPLTISTQKVDTWKKRVQRPNLCGSTYFCQQAGKVWVSASGDHQEICEAVLGRPTRPNSLPSYVAWDDVSAHDLVEILWRLEKS